MNKLTFLGLLSLLTVNFLVADEYISDAYIEQMTTQSALSSSESIHLLPIAKTVEQEAREKEQNSTRQVLVKEEVAQSKEPKKVDDTQETVQETGIEDTYLEALKNAKEHRKVILLAIRATDCPYCDKMETETLSDESVKDALEADFVTVHYNQDLEPLPLGLQEGMTPNFIFVDTNENIIEMYPGMRTPKEFKEALAEILAR